jgi:hypothetical protein
MSRSGGMSTTGPAGAGVGAGAGAAGAGAGVVTGGTASGAAPGGTGICAAAGRASATASAAVARPAAHFLELILKCILNFTETSITKGAPGRSTRFFPRSRAPA